MCKAKSFTTLHLQKKPPIVNVHLHRMPKNSFFLLLYQQQYNYCNLTLNNYQTACLRKSLKKWIIPQLMNSLTQFQKKRLLLTIHRKACITGF